MKLTRRDKRVLAAGFLIVLSIVGWTQLLSPMQQRWRRSRTALMADREELQKLERIASDRQYQQRERQRVAGLVHEMSDLAAAQLVVPVLINDVRSVGQGHSVRITRYEPLPPKMEDTYATYSLNLTLECSLANLVGFLEDLQRHEPVIAVRRLHVVPPSETAAVQELSVEMLVTTYAIEKLPTGDDSSATVSVGEEEVG
ncbi:MAG: type 4a pilus biogenesis protein PilO [Candidatus Zipacnadales bacterium]